MKMWAGRFRAPLNAEFERWQRSFPFDRRLLPQEIAASRAWARALGKAGVLCDAETENILAGLAKIQDHATAPDAAEWLESSDAEDVHHFVEQQLVLLIGEPGYKLHTGRSRNEQIATDLRLFTRDSIDCLRRQLAALIEAFLEKAGALGQAAMPAYTHLQRAEPVLAAHWLLAYVEMFLRDAERLVDCRARVNVLPLGSGAIVGPGLELDRAALAAELGFARISANSVDATSDRDFVLEFLNVASLMSLHLSRFAEEMALFSTVEFGFVRLPDEFATGSSAMPQKKNPDAPELLRGKAGRITGAALSVLLVMKGLPLAYNKDLQETQEPLFAAADSLHGALEITTSFIKAVAFDTERMASAAAGGFLNATAAARYLVRRGVPFRRAHAAVGEAVQFCLEKGCELEKLSLDELRRFSPEFQQDFYSALKLDSILASHNVPGGTSPARVQEALATAHRRLAKLRE